MYVCDHQYVFVLWYNSSCTSNHPSCPKPGVSFCISGLHPDNVALCFCLSSSPPRIPTRIFSSLLETFSTPHIQQPWQMTRTCAMSCQTCSNVLTSSLMRWEQHTRCNTMLWLYGGIQTWRHVHNCAFMTHRDLIWVQSDVFWEVDVETWINKQHFSKNTIFYKSIS